MIRADPYAARSSLRPAAEHALMRAAGAPLVAGNRVVLLRDAGENYPAWLSAIEGAKSSITLEMYIFADDPIGNRFAAAMTDAARRGVRVRILQDWLGERGEASADFWERLEDAGVKVRFFNPFQFGAPLAWLRRNHRKSLVVDGRIGFVTGLCIAARWAGDPARGIPAWRDTGVQIEGPAVADLAHAFAATWAEAGSPDPDPPPRREEIAPAGDVSLRVVATEPATTGMFRLDSLVATVARRSLWLTDAYFIGLPTYAQALRAAAMDGVDVRLLVPGSSDLGVVKRLGAAGLRPLLEAGIRVFEWNGPMLHAKTAVADGTWARVGSTNLNIASWMGNWELDVAIEDQRFAAEMERSYEQDLANATEVVLGKRHPPSVDRPRFARRAREGSAVATAGAIRMGTAVTASHGGHRVLRPAEAGLLLGVGVALVSCAVIAVLVPWIVVLPFAIAAVWLGGTLVVNGWKLRRARFR
ncbi:MAG: phospholipase D-like domain-containing protein [Myxococcales bacterium]